MPVNPYLKYKEQSVMTMTQGEMLLRLYDEVVKQLSAAVMYIGEKNHEKSNAAMQKSQQIINYLSNTLNDKYEISQNLASLYEYFNYQIVNANMHKDVGPLNEVISMVGELRDAFAQADRLSKAK